MTPRLAIFAARWRAWAPALLFLLVNLGVFSVYRLAYAGRIAALDERLRTAESERSKAESERDKLVTARGQAETGWADLDALYRERFSTERLRLTRMITEVKGLAEKAGLHPDRIAYPVEEIKDYGLIKKSVVFSVTGTYPQLRQLVNFLELSSSFLTLESVRLGGSTSLPGELKIDLTISTLFAEDGTVPRPAARARPPAPAPAPTPAPVARKAAEVEG